MSNRRPPSFGDSATRRQHSNRGPSIDELKTASMGQWSSVLHDAGLSADLLDGRGHPCPRCGGRDRFSAFPDIAQRGSVHCRSCFHSGTEPRPGDGLATLRWLMACDTATACRWLAGWLGLDDAVDRPAPPPMRRTVPLRASSRRDGDMDRLAIDCHHAMRSTWWTRLANHLALPATELKRLHVGWSWQYNATTWPMRDHDDDVVGVRLRCMNTGRKWSVSGGKAGLFVPSQLPVDIERLFITEGPTDCAAILSIGFDCVGRPSCNGAVAFTTKLIKRLHPSECVIVADDDTNKAGKRGAESLAASLVTVCPSVRIIYPPDGHNDARDWVRSGASADDVLSIVNATVARSLTLKGDAR
ncbi:Zinc-binding domain of primase-helicase [Stieleria neptunia]|uniref:Zinc-binding domain of primase-helicase n=2 Tax=Stieleria neptunia TaxID=2527979 RepID=A0A518HVV1_9BACT|nr:Zinc-binding domain of primase-helicase [Stieleria neptunia]